VNPGTLRLGGAGQAARISQRIDRPAPAVAIRSEIEAAARDRSRLLAIQHLDRTAALLEIFRPRLQLRERALRVGGDQVARANNRSGDIVLLGQLEYELGAVFGGLVQPRAIDWAIAPLDLLGRELRRRRDMAAIAAGSAPANLVRLEQRHVRPELCSPERGGGAGYAAADDDDVGRPLAEQRFAIQTGAAAARIGGARRSDRIRSRKIHR